MCSENMLDKAIECLIVFDESRFAADVLRGALLVSPGALGLHIRRGRPRGGVKSCAPGRRPTQSVSFDMVDTRQYRRLLRRAKYRDNLRANALLTYLDCSTSHRPASKDLSSFPLFSSQTLRAGTRGQCGSRRRRRRERAP